MHVEGIIVAETCYYSKNQVFAGGVTNRDMLLNKTCYCLGQYRILKLPK